LTIRSSALYAAWLGDMRRGLSSTVRTGWRGRRTFGNLLL